MVPIAALVNEEAEEVLVIVDIMPELVTVLVKIDCEAAVDVDCAEEDVLEASSILVMRES